MEQTTVRGINQLSETTLHQIDMLKKMLERHLQAVRDQRMYHPNGRSYSIGDNDLDVLYEKCAYIREYGEAINFNLFSCSIDQIEKLLKKLRTPIQYRRTDILSDLLAILEHLEQSLE